MTLLLSCLRLGVDVARDPAALLAFVDAHTDQRARLGHDERTQLHLHTRAAMASLKRKQG